MKPPSFFLVRLSVMCVSASLMLTHTAFAMSGPILGLEVITIVSDQQSQESASVPQTPAPQLTPSTQSPLPSAPLGTAAAPDMRPEGGSASRPAGAAIAAAKQKRAHSFALRVGLLVGAGIAIGTVVALSAGSSSRPN